MNKIIILTIIINSIFCMRQSKSGKNSSRSTISSSNEQSS